MPEAVAEPKKPYSPFRKTIQRPGEPPKEVPLGSTGAGNNWSEPNGDGTFTEMQELESGRDMRTDEQILKGEMPDLKPEAPKVSEEDRKRIYAEMREKALVEFHLTRAKALVGHPEMYSLDEIQKISDLFPVRTNTFEQWWEIQLARQTEVLRAQAKKS